MTVKVSFLHLLVQRAFFVVKVGAGPRMVCAEGQETR